MNISSREQKIISILLERGSLTSSEVHGEIVKRGEEISLVTVKRALSELVKRKLVALDGAGRSTAYHVSISGRVFADVNAHEYCAVEPDRRLGMRGYNFDLFASMPVEIFSPAELKILEDATIEYTRRTKDIPPAIEKRELERLVVELSWKSSKIEGNTYTLLDTEKLILENKKAPGHSQKETQMILNHKDAFMFVRENAPNFRTLSRSSIEQLHAILVKDLSVGFGFRERQVGVIGSVYRPLGIVYQIQEGVDALADLVSRLETPFAKALIALLGLSYLQPFEDGNKRTARLLANAILLAYECAPLSYRSVEENAYREAMLVFYEINSIVPFKNIFIGQYDFAARNYAVKS